MKDIDGSNFSTTLKMSATRPRGTLDISENNMMRDSSIDNRQDFNATNHSEDSNLDDDFYLDTRKVSIGDVHNDDDNSWGAVSQPILSMEQPSPVTRASHGGSYTTNFEETKNRQSITRLSNSTMKRLSSRLAASKGKASGAEDSQTPGDRYNAYGPTENFEDANEDDFLKGDVRDSFSVGSLVDNFIGVRKTSSHADSNKTASASSSSKDKIIASRPKSSLQSASNRSRSPHPVAKSKSDSAKEIVESDLIRKGKELESELETYRTENAALKKARKQHEQTLAEVIRQKEEFARWVAEEKQKTLLWCEEQKQLAIKERRAAAKAASESRLKAGTPAMPIRKEKAEIEGLKATIEKMKLDNEKAVKKFKANENRLYSNIKEHAQKLDELRLQNISLEEEKLALFEIIDAAGLRIPKHLKASIQKLLSREALLGKSNRKYHNSLNNSTNYGVPDSYGEEVDVECLQVSSSYHVDQDSYQDADCGYNMVQKTEKEEEEGLDYRINDLSLNNEIVNRTEEIGKVGVNSSLNASNSWARSSTRSNRYGTAGEELSSYEHSSVHEVKIHGSIDNGRSSLDKRLGNTASQNDSGQISSFMKTSSDVLHRKPNTETAIPSLSKTSYLAGTIAENQEVNNFGVKPDSSGRTEKFLSDGRRVIHYRNGTVKEVSPDGSYIVKFVNGDTKQANPKEGTITYFYAEANTKHITYTTDGLEIYEFPNEQVTTA